MKTNFWHNTLMAILVVFILGLSAWATFGDFETDQRITLFGIVGVVIAAITSVYSVSYNQKKTKEREIEHLQFNELKLVMNHFYDAFFEIMNNVKNNKNGLTRKVENEMMLFKRGLMNWGNENIINAYYKYEQDISDGSGKLPAKEMGMIANRFLLEIRKELRFKDNKSLKVYSLILTPEARRELDD